MSATRIALVFACISLADPLVADVPPQDFFTGQYRMIGITTMGPVDQRLRIDPAAEGFVVKTCDGDLGSLTYDTAFESRFLVGNIGGLALNCQYFIDHDNYPLLTCYGKDGTRLTLWPHNGDFAIAPLTCG